MQSFLKGSLLILLSCATVVAGVTIRREVATYRARLPKLVSDWRWYAQGGHRLGPSSAQVTVVVFADYECPFTKEVARDLLKVQKQMPSAVSVVYRHYPLNSHPQAREAAAALECAAQQGRFAELQRMLIDDTGSTLDGDLPAWVRLAAATGIGDGIAFEQCMASPATKASIETDLQAGRRLGVPATPTLIVNGRKYAGAPRDVEEIVRAAAKAARD